MKNKNKRKPKLTRKKKKETNKKAMRESIKNMSKMGENQQEMQKKQQEMMAPIYKKVQTAIQNVGKAGQYTYIFEQGAALYIGTGSKDVTSEVKAELNKLK